MIPESGTRLSDQIMLEQARHPASISAAASFQANLPTGKIIQP